MYKTADDEIAKFSSYRQYLYVSVKHRKIIEEKNTRKITLEFSLNKTRYPG